MAWNFRAQATGTSTPSEADLTIPKPADTTEGDVLVAVVTTQNFPSITPPSGWTTIHQGTYGSPERLRVAVFGRIAGSSEPADYTFAHASGNSVLGAIAAYYNPDEEFAGYDQLAFLHEQNTATPTAPEATVRDDASLAVAIYAGRHTASATFTTTPPGGYTERVDTTTSDAFNGHVLAIADKASNAGAIGAADATFSASVENVWGGHLILAPRNPRPTFHGSATGFSSYPSGTTVSINRPSGTRDGDLLLAFISAYGAGVSAVPEGWAELANQAIGGSSGLRIYWRVAAATDPSSWTWTFSAAASVTHNGLIVAYGSAGGISARSMQADTSGTNSGDMTAPSVTTVVAYSLLVCCWWHASAAGRDIAPPAGMTERAQSADTGLGAPPVLTAAEESIPSAGATGSRVATSTTNASDRAGASVAVEPPQSLAERWGVVPIA